MSSIKLLIVDDSIVELFVLKKQIATVFEDTVEIYTADSISEARKLFLNNSFDLVILDLFLLDSTGYDTVKRIYELDDNIPIIVYSGVTDTKVKLMCLANGVEHYAHKLEEIDWSHLIISVIDGRRRADKKTTSLEKRLESLTGIIESLVSQIKEVNVAVFGNCTEESKKASLINQIIETKNELKSTNDVTEIIKMVFWITVPIVIAIFAAATVYVLFGFKA